MCDGLFFALYLPVFCIVLFSVIFCRVWHLFSVQLWGLLYFIPFLSLFLPLYLTIFLHSFLCCLVFSPIYCFVLYPVFNVVFCFAFWYDCWLVFSSVFWWCSYWFLISFAVCRIFFLFSVSSILSSFQPNLFRLLFSSLLPNFQPFMQFMPILYPMFCPVSRPLYDLF